MNFTLSGSALKVVAVLSMISDHAAYFLLPSESLLYEVLRILGRIAFPVFAFLAAEGFLHTSNRVKYALHLLLFALLSEIPWFLLFGADGTHNVLFTLLLGILVLAVFASFPKRPFLGIAVLTTVAVTATLFGVDYEWRGVLLVAVFYLFGSAAPAFLPSGKSAQLICAFPLMMHYGFLGALAAAATLFLYDGSRGFIRGSLAKYAFYAFYPLHLFFFLVAVTF